MYIFDKKNMFTFSIRNVFITWNSLTIL